MSMYSCVSIWQPREAEERADSKHTDSTFVWTHTAGQQQLISDLHHKKSLSLIAPDSIRISLTHLVFHLRLRFCIGHRGKSIDALFYIVQKMISFPLFFLLVLCSLQPHTAHCGHHYPSLSTLQAKLYLMDPVFNFPLSCVDLFMFFLKRSACLVTCP